MVFSTRLRVLTTATALLVGTSDGLAQILAPPRTVGYPSGTVVKFQTLEVGYKKLTHGPFLRYQELPEPDKSLGVLLTTGHYDHDKRVGEWRSYHKAAYFSPVPKGGYYAIAASHPPEVCNKLESKGRYQDGLAEGTWTYYYPPTPEASGRPFRLKPDVQAGIAAVVADTLGVVGSRSYYHLGEPVKSWNAYDERGKLTHTIEAATGRLTYWQPATGPSLGKAELARNHPLMYFGGKRHLVLDLSAMFNSELVLKAADKALAVGQIRNSKLVLGVDSTGRRTVNVTLSAPESRPKEKKYDQLLALQANGIGMNWLPRTVNGKRLAAEYHLLVMTEKIGEKNVRIAVRPLGE